MGYDEWIRVEISKEGCDAKTIKIALSLAFPSIVECIEECDQYKTEGEDCLHFEREGRHLWDRLMLFEEFSVKEISEKLGCDISLYYEGEDKEDAESLQYVDGKIKAPTAKVGRRGLAHCLGCGKNVIILEENRMVDDEARKRIRAMARRVFDNDGIEEFVPELVGFAEVICPHANPKELKAATHAAFVAMLGGFKVDEAVELVLKNRDDILTAVLEYPND